MTDALPTPLATARPGAATADLLGCKLVAHYGDEAAEAHSLRTRAGLIDLGMRDLVRVAGDDGLLFLHRMLTQDLQKLPVGTSRRSALLVRKGQLVAEMWAVRAPGGELWLDISPGRGEAVRENLEPYVIMDDVTFEPLAETATLIGVIGPVCADMLAAAGWPTPESGAVVEHDGLAIVDRPCGDLPGVAVRVPLNALDTVVATLVDAGAVLAGLDAAEVVRVEQGVARWGSEWHDSLLPKEGGLDDAVSYTKGCFVGQEPTSRLHFRGQPARRLVRLTIAGDAMPEVGSMLRGDGKDAGRLTSTAATPHGVVALGYVKRAFLEPGTLLHIGSDDGPAATVSEPVGRDTPR